LKNELVAIVLVVTIASLALNVYQYSSPRSVTVTTSFNTSTTITASVNTSNTCIIVGQPAGILFRVLADSTLEPVAGVSVTAINTPALCNGSPATSQTFDTFTTNGTEWLPLPSDNNYQYSFVANYLGQTYAFTATLGPVSMTCTTLLVPSGRTNVTITEGGGACR
jgi:hypothetical protein